MADIFEEVEEEVRKDRLGDLWRRFGWIVWLAAILIVGFVGFSEWRSGQVAAERAAQSSALDAALQALEEGDYAAAQASFQDMVDAGTPLSPLAAHLLAEARLVGGGDPEGAVAALALVADAEGSPYAQLALLKSVYLRAETMDLANMETELAPLIATETQLGALAEEVLAAKAFAEGDFARARRDYNRLMIAANAPAGLRQRARIAVDAIPRTASADVAPEPVEPDGPVDDAAEPAGPERVEEIQ
ncbi:MAG: tetratricopeptide repeat protein [Pseudomonadota bacterium]